MKRKILKTRIVFSIKLVLLIATIFIVLPTIVQAINLGTVLKTNYAEVRRGETTIFTTLFWNTDDSSVPVKITLKQAPLGWIIIIKPDEFTLDQSKPEHPPYEKDVEYINLQDTIIKTTPVEVLVKVPKSVKEGEYKVIVNVNAGKKTEGISVLTERNLKFTVNVLKDSKIKEREVPDFTILSKDLKDKLTGMTSLVIEQSNILLLFVSVLVVMGTFWLIKRSL